MDTPLTHEQALAAATSAAALIAAVLAWGVAAVFLIRGRRGAPLLEGVDRSPAWLVAWHACGLLALLPTPDMWTDVPPPAVLLVRALGGMLAACLGAGLIAWEAATRARYVDRSPAVASRPRFLTYGPYARVRRPRELGLLLLVCGTAFALPGWWRPAVALGVFGSSLAVRARRLDDALAEKGGEEFARYRMVTALLLPTGRRRDRRATG